MRDVLLSATAGFLFSCGGAFVVHRALWKTANEYAEQLDSLVGNGVENESISRSSRRPVSYNDYQFFHNSALCPFLFPYDLSNFNPM